MFAEQTTRRLADRLDLRGSLAVVDSAASRGDSVERHLTRQLDAPDRGHRTSGRQPLLDHRPHGAPTRAASSDHHQVGGLGGHFVSLTAQLGRLSNAGEIVDREICVVRVKGDAVARPAQLDLEVLGETVVAFQDREQMIDPGARGLLGPHPVSIGGRPKESPATAHEEGAREHGDHHDDQQHGDKDDAAV